MHGRERVDQVMTKDPLTVGLDMLAGAAEDLMKARGVRHLPVVDASAHLVGILTDRDLAHAAFMPLLSGSLGWSQRRLKALRVRDLMSWSVVTTRPGATLAEAGATMFQRRIGCLPVVEEGRLVGILTDRDMLRALGQEGGA